VPGTSLIAPAIRGQIRGQMSSRVVLLFSGQGAQTVGMAKDLAEGFPSVAARFAQADAILGFGLSAVMFDGPEDELKRTSFCQPALYLHGYACLDCLRERVDLDIAAAAGLSLGEFTAYAAASAFSFEDGLRLVARRGAFMEEACKETEGSMAAMIGGEESAVRRLAEAADVDVANLNAPGQIVISGSREGIAKAIAEAKDFGIRISKELNVAGAYHSRLMQSAKAKLSAELAATRLEPPRFPVVGNFRADAIDAPDGIRHSLEAQVTGSVRWAESMEKLLDAGHDLFLELGPGGVLEGLMKRIRKGVRVIGVHDRPSLEAAVAELS